MPRRLLLLGMVIAAVAGLASWFRPGPRPNLLLITLDTTRADRLGCYGYSGGRTSTLDSLAAAGVVCEHAYTVAPLTLPAHASLFTGLYPVESGIRTNGRGRLDDALPTLAEVLQRQKYETGAFVASYVLNGKFGLDRGFSKYDDDFVDDKPSADSVQRERNGESVVDAALAWLGKNHTRPFFCWVHLFDPHAPYRAHFELFGEEFADRPYDAEIAYADQQVERLLEFLKRQGLESQTLVVVVADHGEGLGEHVERTHSATLYNATMHVPLIFRQPGRLAAGRRVSSNLSIVDLFPTILELLGAAGPRQMTGRSFKAALTGSPVGSSRCYGATDEPFLRSGWSPLRSILDGSWKYIRTARPELYDLASDPHERNNLAEAHPDRTRAMEALLAEFESRLVPRAGAPVQLSPAERRALASLGYVGGTTATPAGPPANFADIKDMLPFDNAVEDAGELMKKGCLDAAIPRLREVIREAPDHTEAHLYLANAFLQKSEYDEAIDTLLTLIARRPDCRDAHFDLGVALLQRGQPDVAAHEFETALKIDPELADAHLNLAKVFFSAGRMDDALAHLDAALQIDRGHGAAYQWRARLLAMQGQIDAALADYRAALKCSPRSPEAHHNLGAMLAEYGDADEARQHLSRAVELEPASAEFHYALGAFLVRQSRFDEAVTHLTKALELRPGYGAAADSLRAARQSQKAQRPDSE